MRQLKNFSRSELLKTTFSSVLEKAIDLVGASTKLPIIKHIVLSYTGIRSFLLEIMPSSYNKRLFMQAIGASTVFLILSSISPSGSFIHSARGYSDEYINNYLISADILVTDDEGYLLKTNPLTSDSNRIGLTDFAVHTVESGETLSQISKQYGVSAETIQWENNIRNSNSIRAGQKLNIPPVNGVSYKVQNADTLDKIAKKYSISAESILAQNNLAEDAKLVRGSSIFLPNAKPIVSEITLVAQNTGSRNVNYTAVNRSVNYANIPANTTTPSGGKIFIYPTRGSITNGYRAGHYAIDIADRSKPPIWAPASGTVTKVSTGTWGGGYGNYIMIDHGNGLQSLYAHFDSVNVVQGQWVNQGDVIGIMGNTGRVYGATGIHLHWEVIDNGVKRNPTLYY
jgi:murein DD-endopeptidase MepM/ murein hydrolase activator NlpD